MMLNASLFCLMLHIASAQWQGPMLPILPVADSYMAVGTYNDTIYIIGGKTQKSNYLAVKYNIATAEFTDIQKHTLHSAVYGYAQFYTQQTDNLYFIISTQSSTASIARYNLKTGTYDATFKHIISSSIHANACLASTTEYLIILGGNTDGDIVLLLDLTTNDWIANTKNLSTSRNGAACIVDPQTDTIYAIGGHENAVSNHSEKWLVKNTIEINNINSITEDEWSLIDNLTIAITRARCVIHNAHIYVIGGVNLGGIAVDAVQIINTQTGQTSVSPYKLAWNVTGCAAIIVADIIYAFGGQSGAYYDDLNIWMYYDLNQHGENANAQKTKPDHLGVGIFIGIMIAIVIVVNIAIFWYIRKKMIQRHASVWDSQLLQSNGSDSTSAYSVDSLWKPQPVDLKS